MPEQADLTGKVEGNFAVLFSTQAALAFGAAVGAALALVLRLTRRMKKT